MDSVSESFNLHTTLLAVSQAAVAVIGHMLFLFALHGLVMAALIALAGLAFQMRGHRFGKPLLVVAQRASVFCLVLCLPGAYFLASSGKLPDAGVFNVNSFGFVGFWSLIYLHLSAEEIYHRFGGASLE